MIGNKINEYKANCKLILNITIANPIILTELENKRTIIFAYISCKPSTSFVTRVTIFPTGFISK